MNDLNRKSIRMISAALLFGMASLADAQIIVGPCGTGNLPSVRENTSSYSVQFTLVGAVAMDWDLTNFGDVEIATQGAPWDIDASGVLTGSIGSDPEEFVMLNLSVTRVGGGSAITGSFLLRTLPASAGEPNICPCIQEFAFVLDESGSMEALTSLGVSKWDRMLNVVGDHWLTLKNAANLDEHDRWAIILFEGNRAELVQSGVFDISDAPVISSIESGHPVGGGGATPMGGGIQRGVTDFFSPSGQAWKQRNVILLTDGSQNRNPVVNGQQLVLDPGRSPATGILGGAFPIDLPTSNIQVFAIGLGLLGGEVEAVLRTLSDNNYENADSPTLDNFFDSTIPSALEDCSPRILDVRRGISPVFDNFKEEAFIVHDSVKSLTLKFIATDSRFTSQQVSVKKNGVSLKAQPVFQNERMVLYHFNFPEDSAQAGGISSKGIWSLRFSDFKPIKYEATAFVDEENIKTKLDFEGIQDFYAGDELPVRLRLTYQGQPISSGIQQVLALRLRPGEDLGDLMAKTPLHPDSVKSTEAQNSIGQSKIETLSLNQGIIDQLKKDSNIINLVYTGNGEYRGVFAQNEVTGSYRIIIMVQGNHPNVGDYTGWRARSAVFDFARPDDILLQDSLIDLGIDTNGVQSYQIRITPLNKFGRKIGPAQENRIKVSLDAGKVGPVVDHLNGSYSALIVVPAGANPTVLVHVIDFQTPVKRSCLACIGKKEPALLVPPNITVSCDTATTTTGVAVISNNCAPNTAISYADRIVAGNCMWACTLERHWYAVDDCGNRLHGTQIITIDAIPKIKQALAAQPLVLGTTQTTLTIDQRSADCISKWFPASGAQPMGLESGKQRVGADCKPGTNPLDGAGRLVNPLLAEAIQLSLLARLDPNFASKKLSEFSCTIHPIVLQALAPNPNINELLRVTNLALGNRALAPNLPELYQALRCINGSGKYCK